VSNQTKNVARNRNATDSIDQPVEPADSTAALTEAAKRAESLAAELHRIADGGGYAASALVEIDRVQEIVPLLEDRHRSHLAAFLGDAAGNAATHTWEATSRTIRCSVCGCVASPSDLKYGRTPMCGDVCPLVTHHMTPIWDGKEYTPEGRSRCMYCKTVYPSTAPEGGAR